MRRKVKKSITIVMLLAFIVAAIIYNYTFNTKHRNIAEEKANVIIASDKLQHQFFTNEALATSKFLDKVIETSGIITSIEDKGVILNGKLQVIFNSEEIPDVKKEQQITIKGRCLGYDELLEIVKIDQATIINQ